MQTPSKKTVRKVANGIVGLSAGFVVYNLIKTNVLPTNTRQKAELWIGSMVISEMVADYAVEHFIGTWNAIEKGLEKSKEKQDEKSQS